MNYGEIAAQIEGEQIVSVNTDDEEGVRIELSNGLVLILFGMGVFMMDKTRLH